MKQLNIIIKKSRNKIIDFLLMGISPGKLSLAISLGITVGISPLYGFTTAICLLLALIFKLNMAAIQFFNYLVWPLQIILIYPFILLSERIFQLENLVISREELMYLFRHNWLIAFKEATEIYLYAAACWLVIAIPATFILFYIFKKIINRINIERYYRQ